MEGLNKTIYDNLLTSVYNLRDVVLLILCFPQLPLKKLCVQPCVGERGEPVVTHTGRKYWKCPIGKTSSNVIVNCGLIYCLGGPLRQARTHVCADPVNLPLSQFLLQGRNNPQIGDRLNRAANDVGAVIHRKRKCATL